MHLTNNSMTSDFDSIRYVKDVATYSGLLYHVNLYTKPCPVHAALEISVSALVIAKHVGWAVHKIEWYSLSSHEEHYMYILRTETTQYGVLIIIVFMHKPDIFEMWLVCNLIKFCLDSRVNFILSESKRNIKPGHTRRLRCWIIPKLCLQFQEAISRCQCTQYIDFPCSNVRWRPKWGYESCGRTHWATHGCSKSTLSHQIKKWSGNRINNMQDCGF